MRAAIALTAVSSLAATTAVCVSFVPVTPAGIAPLAFAFAALLAISFVPLILGQEPALKRLPRAMIVWPAAGTACIGLVRSENVTVRVAVALSICAAVAAYATYRSSLSRERFAGSGAEGRRRTLATVDRDTLASMSTSGFSPRAAVMFATPGWLVAAQLGLVAVGLTASTGFLAVVAAVPQATEPGNVAAAVVTGVAYLRCHYYFVGWFSFHPTEATRGAVALFLAVTIAGCAAVAWLQIVLLGPLDAARIHGPHAREMTTIIAALAALSVMIDAFVLARVLELDVARLAKRGYRVGDD